MSDIETDAEDEPASPGKHEFVLRVADLPITAPIHLTVHPMPSQMVDPKSIQAIPEEREVEERIKVETANGDSREEGHVRMTVHGDGGGSDNMHGNAEAGGDLRGHLEAAVDSDSAAAVDFMEVPGAVTNGLPETIKEEDEEDVSEHP